MRPCRPAEELHDHRPANGAKPEPPRRPARDPYGLLPDGHADRRRALDRRPARHRHRDPQPDQRQAAVHAGQRWRRAAGRPTRSRRGPPTPSNVVEVPSIEVPGIDVPGTLVYAKDGNIWIQTGDQATQLTAPARASTTRCRRSRPDGKSRVLRPDPQGGRASGASTASSRTTSSTCPTLMRVTVADGIDGPPARRHRRPGPAASSGTGSSASRSVSPDGRYVAMATDLPDPTKQRRDAQAVRHARPTRSTTSSSNQVAPLGHQDPGLEARRQQARCTCSTTVTAPRARPGSTPGPRTPSKARPVTGPGYLHPAWSPDGQYIAATKTSAYGTDVVILNAANGAELAAAHRRRQQLGADVVAARGPDRVPARRGPGHRPADGPARGHGAQLDGQGHARPDHRGGPRRRVAARLVRRRPPTSRPRPRPHRTGSSPSPS